MLLTIHSDLFTAFTVDVVLRGSHRFCYIGMFVICMCSMRSIKAYTDIKNSIYSRQLVDLNYDAVVINLFRTV